MPLEDTFQKLLNEWKIYCCSIQYSNNPDDYLNCSAYKEIVQLSTPALPLIKEVYSKVNENTYFAILGWTKLIKEIVGKEFVVPKELSDRIEATREYTVQWLDKNMDKYVPSK